MCKTMQPPIKLPADAIWSAFHRRHGDTRFLLLLNLIQWEPVPHKQAS